MKSSFQKPHNLPNQIFYARSTNVKVGSMLCIEGSEHDHISKSLRKSTGEILFLTDGEGRLFETKIIEIQKKTTHLSVIQELDVTAWYNSSPLVLAIAPTKNMKRTEWIVEKCTEIGVHALVPFYSQYSERNTIRLDRLQHIAVSAMKQSLQLHVPQIENPVSFTGLIETFAQTIPHRYIANMYEQSSHLLNETISDRQPSIVLIGPEGGFSAEEIELAQQNGFKSITLGKNRLRSETAAVYACSLMNAKYDQQ